jgi:hypothetical protein
MATRRRTISKKRTKARPTRPRDVGGARPGTKAVLERTVRALERRLVRAAAALAAIRVEQRKKVAAVRRAADRRLAAMVQELAALRHHEARATALERMLAERNAAVAVERRDDGETSGTAG